ncbi:adhesin/hemagglutinin, HecA family [Pseudomonas synxantha BG33R]|nr:adhesin/hemagglutinin, HecA family [Pseudomonas synxantha BG33R]
MLNLGSNLKAGGNASVTAGRDVLIASQTEQDDYAYQRRRISGTEQTILQHASAVDVGGNLAIDARRDIAVVASTVSAAKDLSVKAGENLTLAAAANEEHDYSKGKKGGTKTTTQLDNVTQQSAELKAGGDLIAVAGTDLTLVASKISAGNEAYVHADNELQMLAAQDSHYSLYDMSKKGSWGSKKTQRDEVTDVKNVGSEVKTGGDLTLESGGDQKYQAAKLESGGDIAIVSGGAVTFEAVKDLHDESHTKSKGDLAWTSSKGKGNTDETLRQTQMIAEGSVVIKAVDGLKIDIKQIDQNTVSQTIDVMVKADPQLAWLKEAEQRGDVDWRQVKELHDSFKYSNSGLGAGAQIIIAIIVTYFTMGAASGAIAAAGSGTSMASATAVGTAATSAGWANAAGSTVLAGMASNGAISAINNRGNLSTVLKDVTSSDAMKGYVVSGVTAGLTAGVYDKWTGTQTGTSTALPNSGAVATVSPLSTWQGVGQFTANQVLQNGTSLLVDRALGGEARLGDALQNSLANAFAAYGFNLVGDVSKNRFAEGGITKIGLHALMGGLAAEASGGDFRTGALAAGVNEALLDSLAKNYADMPDDQKKGLLVMNSQLLGVLAASVQSNADADSLQTGAWVAQNMTQYNFLEHLSPGLSEYGSAATTLAKDMLEKGATNDQIAQAQLKLAQGQGFEGVQPANEFVKAWGYFMAGELTGAGLAAVLGRLVMGGAKGLPSALQNFGGRTFDDLSAAASNPINKEGLTEAARALTKHASGQRATGTFPKLTGGIEKQNATALGIIDDVLKNPNSTFSNLSRGGLEVRAPDGRGLRYNKDGSFSGFLDPKAKP